MSDITTTNAAATTSPATATDRRIHISLDVRDLARSIQFYEMLLDTPPSKTRPDYAKFEPGNPAVNLALNQVASDRGSATNETRVSHFGIQVADTEVVRQIAARLQRAGLATYREDQVTCCYAVQDKVWVQDPDGNAWEIFVVTHADAAVHSIPVGDRLPSKSTSGSVKASTTGSTDESTTGSAGVTSSSCCPAAREFTCC